MATLPKLQTRKDGKKVFIYWQRKKIYLGDREDPSTIQKYLAIVGTLPEPATKKEKRADRKGNPGSRTTPLFSAEKPLDNSTELLNGSKEAERIALPMRPTPHNTLAFVLQSYIDYYTEQGTHRAEINRAQTIQRLINQWYPGILAEDFDALEVANFRDRLHLEGYDKNGKHYSYTRQYLNKMVNNIRAIYAWGVGQRLVTAESHNALKKEYLRPLRYDQTDAPEAPKKRLITDDEVRPVYRYLSPIYADILFLIERTGMRPGEISEMRWEYIDQSDDVWIYRPKNHKTAGKGKERVIGLGKQCQNILSKYKDETGYIFTPKRVLLEHWAEQTRNRKTPPRKSQSTGARIAKLKEQLSPDVITKNIRWAVKKAIENGELKQGWTPYYLRHKAISEEIEQSDSILLGAKLAGHSTPQTTAQYYDHSDLAIIKKIASRRG